ncbi:MAG: right-handed parallel beta-helix repeat-containing protein [Planctomycetota bacterium]
MRNLCWMVLVSCLLIRQAAARDIFVDNVGGDDKNNGMHSQNQGDTGNPVRTIAKALRLARAGDRVILANSDQPYRECVALVGTRHSGAASLMPFILDGNGATLDGSAAIPAEGWTYFRDNIFRFRPKTLFQPVLFVSGRAIQPLPLPQATASPPRLEPLQWCAIEGAIYFAVEAGRLPPDYKLSYAELPTGITLYQVDQVLIRNLTIRGFRADGVAAAVGTRNAVLDNVTCTANGQNGVSVRGGAQVEIESCKLAGNGQSQLLTFPNSETHLLASDLANDTARGWVNQGGRVYLGSMRIEGGKKSIRSEDAPKPKN